jgi:hypothetical protein
MIKMLWKKRGKRGNRTKRMEQEKDKERKRHRVPTIEFCYTRSVNVANAARSAPLNSTINSVKAPLPQLRHAEALPA